MSGKHQRRLWVLPIRNASQYDRMHIGVGRANSSNILVRHDTLTKTLLNYLFQQDTLVKTLTNIQVHTDTLITVSVSFNYQVDHDTLLRILTSVNINHDTSTRVVAIPSPIQESYVSGSGRILAAPIWVRRKKKKADEIITLEKLDISKLPVKRNIINIRIEAMFEIKLTIGDVRLLTENDVQNLTILNVDFIDSIDEKPIEIKVFKEEDL